MIDLTTIDRNDVVRLTFREKAGDRVFEARILWAEVRDAGEYFGYQPLDSEHGLWGATMLRKTPARFGLQQVELVRTEPLRPDRHRGPRPGDRGYDLMC